MDLSTFHFDKLALKHRTFRGLMQCLEAVLNSSDGRHVVEGARMMLWWSPNLFTRGFGVSHYPWLERHRHILLDWKHESAMTGKIFKLGPDQIHPLATQRGCCFVSDMITVQGKNVGDMYREEPDFENDSGWRFLAGTESQEYLDDPEIIPFLDEINDSAPLNVVNPPENLSQLTFHATHNRRRIQPSAFSLLSSTSAHECLRHVGAF